MMRRFLPWFTALRGRHHDRLKAPKDGCVIRMYRHGLGDCFLLAFANGAGHQKYMMIDCGVLLGTGGSERLGTRNVKETIALVAKDIKAATGGRIHRMVVTHEHWDHISGFHQAGDLLYGLNVDRLWLAWTEDPKDSFAQSLKKRKRRAIAEIEAHMATNPAGVSPGVRSVMEFFGAPAASGRKRTDQIMDDIQETWLDVTEYLRPGGDAHKIRGLPDVSFFVLGPPRDKKFIKKKPSFV